ncbi:hypothetical protein FHX44_117873 [Pseudonocardia hierapolitana]|uniref:Uncharacterized protein n=1 Tax=Pseudonocardia hierapolitana TaxID=1128676 RepID=A0A561T481_9PSEU|nr:hypothetical protein [Pseudonocardia hierapolitana]TWF81928.1 hypothetical protein FHX44_117873 [Pseudonocardia hierapolitana]
MLRRRDVLRAAGVGALAGLAGCARSGDGPDGDLRLLLNNHVWNAAIRERIGEFEDLATGGWSSPR